MSDDWVYFQIEPSQMTYVTRIIEGYGYLGVVTALNGVLGTGFVRTTPDTAPITREILSQMPFGVKILTRLEAENLNMKK